MNDPLQTAKAYLKRTRGWNEDEYRLEFRGEQVIVAVYLEDEAATHPGAGKSVVLRIDDGSVSETGMQ